MEFGTTNTFPSSTPVLDVTVTCRNILAAKPRCTEAERRPAEGLRSHGSQ
jgi:hypothetical protein